MDMSPGRRKRPRRWRPKLPGPVYVVKSQIHAGGRGAGRFADDPNGKGGVRLARSPAEVKAAAEAMIGHTLVTKQTGPHRTPGAAGLCRGRMRHRQRTLFVAPGRSGQRSRHHHRLHGRWHGGRGSRRQAPGEDSACWRRSSLGHLRVLRSPPRLGAWVDRQTGRCFWKIRRRHLRSIQRFGLCGDRDQSPCGHRRR